MMQVYMVIGCPGSGKTWVCAQLIRQYQYVRHDSFIGANYVAEIVRQSKTAAKPLLIETPFSVSQIKDPLELQGFRVTPVFIQELPIVIMKRYLAREGKPIPTGHLARQTTYMARALEWQSFHGTSDAVLAYLKNAVPEVWPWE
jgi:hypothetical protein